MTVENTSGAAKNSPKKKGKLKWVLVGAGVLVVGGVLLVGLTPTLLSTSAGKNFVLGKVNDSLAGRVEAGSLSLGWFSGVQLEDVKVYDDQKRLAISVGKISTELTLLRAIRGDYRIGNTVIDSPNLVLVEVDKDGSTNLDRIAKSEAPNPKSETSSNDQKKANDQNKTKSALPSVKGQVTIKNLTGTIQGAAVGAKPVRIGSSDILVKIPDLANSPVSNDIKLSVGRDGSAMGTLTLVGDAQAVFAGAVDTDKLTANEKLTLVDLDLGALAPVLAKMGLEVSGKGNGALDVKATALDNAVVNGQIVLADLSVGGSMLKGDTFQSKSVTIPLDVTAANSVVTVRKAGIESAEMQVSVAGEVNLLGLMAGADQGSAKPNVVVFLPKDGRIVFTASVPNVGTIAKQLHRSLSLADDVVVTGGAINSSVNLTFADHSASFSGATALTGVKGTRGNQPVAISDVNAVYDVKAGFDGKQLTALTINKAGLTSSFAQLSATGTLNDLSYTANVDLDRARQELSQFVDMTDAQLAGKLTSQGMIKGDFMNGGDVSGGSTTTLQGLRVAMAGGGEGSGVRGQGSANTGMSFSVDSLRADMGIAVTGQGDARKSTIQKLTVDAGNVTLVKGGKDVLRGENLKADVAGEVGKTSGGGTHLVLTALDVKSSSGLVSVTQQGGQLVIETKADGSMNGSGGVAFSADLARLAKVGAAWSGGSNTADSDLKSGRAAGQLTFGQNGDQTMAKGNVDLTGLTVGGMLNNESVSMVFDANTPDAGKTATVSADVKSSFANVTMKDAKLTLSGGVWETVQAANISVRADDLAKLDALYNSLVPPAKAGPAGTPGQGRDAPATGTPAANALAEAAAQPLTVRAGRMAAEVAVARKGTETTLNVGSLKVTGLELAKGSAAYRMPSDVDLKLAMTVDAATANGKTTSEQIKSVTISAMDGSLGVATVKLAEPIVVTGLGGGSLNGKGTVQLAGKLQTVAGMMEVLKGAAPGTLYPYTGDFTVEQKVASSGDMTTLTGSAVVNNLQVLDGKGKVAVSESKLEVGNDVGVNLKNYDVELKKFSVNTASSGAMNLTASGLIRDGLGARKFEQPLKMSVKYDLAKLMPLVVPVMDPTGETYGGATFTGQFSKDIVVTGAYPSGLKSNEAIRQVKATGGVAVATATLPKLGVELGGFDQNFVLENGVLTLVVPPGGGLGTVAPAGAVTPGGAVAPGGAGTGGAGGTGAVGGAGGVKNAPAPQAGVTKAPAGVATFNGGLLDISGLTVNLTGDSMRVSGPANKSLFKDVQLNKLLGDRLGWMGSFLLKGNDDTKGLMDLVLVRCDKFPLGEAMNSTGPENDGVLEVNLTIRSLQMIGGPMGDILSKIPGASTLTSGELRQGKVVIEKGVVTQEIDYRMSAGQIRTDGGINLGNKTFRPLTVYIAPAFLQGAMKDFGSKIGLGFLGENAGKLTDLPIPITGTVDHPTYNVAGSFSAYAGNAFKNLGGIGGGLLDKLTGKDPDKGGTTKPAEKDPVGGLLNGLLGGGKQQGGQGGQQQPPPQQQPQPQQQPPGKKKKR